MFVTMLSVSCLFSILNTKQTNDGIFRTRMGKIRFGKNILKPESFTLSC